jgi:hypothetical protein
MIQVSEGLWVGSEADYLGQVFGRDGWCVVHACKEPYHRRALGYSGRAAPKTHPEYLVAHRGSRLCLNFIDAPNAAYIPIAMVDEALAFMRESLASGTPVFVHCNQGMSRAPTLALLYLARFTRELPPSLDAAVAEFRRRYPPYQPAGGVWAFTVANWPRYCAGLGDDGCLERSNA